MTTKRKKESHKRVGSKISLLEREGEKPSKAIATALSMERAGRLRKGGKYVRAKRKGRKATR